MRKQAARTSGAEATAGAAAAAPDANTSATALRGMSYDEQVASLTPGADVAPAPAPADGKKAAEDKATEVQATDVPGVLFSNTSKTNLNKQADWVARLGFALGTAYTARVSLDDLIVAGRDILAPSATAVGPVRVPPGAGTSDALEYDYIETPTGRVSEKGVNRFTLRAGAGAPGGAVDLSFANNGALNLARLARAAYELAIAKGVTVRGRTVDYHGQTLALSCQVQMGNEVKAEGARAYGYVGELELKWMTEKVHATVEAICAATSVALNKAMDGDRGTDPRRVESGMALHPNHAAAIGLRTEAKEKVATKEGGTALKMKPGVRPIQSSGVNDATVKSWGSGEGQQAWIQDPAAVAAAAQAKVRGAWLPGKGVDLHPSYLTECPDFTGQLAACFAACGTKFGDKAAISREILQTVKAIGAGLQLAPMERPLIGDVEHQAALEVANKKVIAAAFAGVSAQTVVDKLAGLQHAKRPPVFKGGADPVQGESPNGEGLVLLNDWTSRDK
ncbi:MAG: hypothetical protein R3F39_14515 [Myxococcota bacterium]